MEPVAVQESGREGPPPPVLALGEEVCLMIEHVTARRGEDALFSDARVTVYVTTLRVVLVLASRPKAVALALRLETVTAIKDASVQSLGIFVTPKVAVKFISEYPAGIITVFFSTELVKEKFLAKSLQVLRAQAWAVVKAPAVGGIGQSSLSSLPALRPTVPTTSSTPVGIAGLQKQQQEQLQKTAELTTDASKDLEHLMTHAQEVVRIVDKYARFLQSDEQADIGARDHRVDESKELETILQSIGMVSPVTKLSAGRKFHEELANELADLLSKEGRLERLRGMVTLTNAYCLLNRARGTELVSPDDLHTAAQVLRCSQHGMQLRRFDSGVLVIQAASLNDTDIARQLVELCSSGCKVGDSMYVGKLATEFSQALGLSLPLCKEQLAMAEQRGALCRDESVVGVRFFPNLFFQ